MDVWKRVALATVATIAAVYLLIWSLDAFGFRNPVFAFLINGYPVMLQRYNRIKLQDLIQQKSA